MGVIMNALKSKKPVYQLRLGISASINEIEEWLERNCEGTYSYQLEDIEETQSVFNKLKLLFEFELESDRSDFKEAVKFGTF